MQLSRKVISTLQQVKSTAAYMRIRFGLAAAGEAYLDIDDVR